MLRGKPASIPGAPLGVPPPRCARAFLALAPRMGMGTGTFVSPHAGRGFCTVTRTGWAQGTGTLLHCGCPRRHTGPPGPVLGKDAMTVPCPAACQHPAPLQPLPQPLAPLPASRTSPGNYSPPPGTGGGTVTLWLLALGTAPQRGRESSKPALGTAQGRCRGGSPSGFVRALSYAPGG